MRGRRSLRRCWLTLALLGCGTLPPLRTATVTAIAPLLLDDVKSLELFLIEGHAAGGEALTCAMLGDDTPLTRDDLVARDHRLTPMQDLIIPDVVQSSDLILIADGYATATASGNRIAHGCSDAIHVAPAQETQVVVTLRAVP